MVPAGPGQVAAGEVNRTASGIAGTSVHITSGAAALARPAEILVSTVKDLVAGSGISLDQRGAHKLAGLSEEWPLFAVAGL